MRHGQYLTEVGNPIDHTMTSKYTPNMLRFYRLYAAFRKQEIEPCASAVA